MTKLQLYVLWVQVQIAAITMVVSARTARISLGYTLMDDASGNYYGKQLIRDYYFKKMPQTIRLAFEHKYNLRS
jgi:hypothetical protein